MKSPELIPKGDFDFPPDAMIKKPGSIPTATPKPSPLSALPVELKLEIAKYLSPTDTVCFALSNIHNWWTLEHQRTKLALKGEAKLPLLRRLEDAMENHFTCACCLILHRYDESKSFGLAIPDNNSAHPLRCIRDGLWRTCQLSLDLQICDHQSQYELQFLKVQLAMRRFYRGPQYGIACKSLSHTQVRGPDSTGNLPILVSIEAQICRIRRPPKASGLPTSREPWRTPLSMADPGPWHLFLRVQDITLVERNDVGFTAGRILPRLRHLNVCKHMGCPRGNTDYKWALIFEEQKVNVELRGYDQIHGNCKICHTSYYLEVIQTGNLYAVVLTRWMSLGPGLSPDDPQWKIHMLQEPECRDDSIIVDPQLSFECNGPQLSHQALRETNMSYLREHEYQRVMNKSDRCQNWILPN
jgi:hypothetical protein